MISTSIRFGAAINALRSQRAADAVAEQYRNQHPERPFATFYSGKDYAVFTSEDAEAAMAMLDARNALEADDPETAKDINRRLDNWVAGLNPGNTEGNTWVELINYVKGTRRTLL